MGNLNDEFKKWKESRKPEPLKYAMVSDDLFRLDMASAKKNKTVARQIDASKMTRRNEDL